MPRKHRKGREELVRDIELAGVRASHSVCVANSRGGGRRIDRMFSFGLTGSLREPVGEAREVEITLKAGKQIAPSSELPLSLGETFHDGPELSAHVFLDPEAYDRIWSLANAGLLKHARLAFTRPRYRRAFVTGF